jgi:hypothetical protein
MLDGADTQLLPVAEDLVEFVTQGHILYLPLHAAFFDLPVPLLLVLLAAGRAVLPQLVEFPGDGCTDGIL